MLRYLLIVVVIKYSLLNPRWRKPEVEVVQNRQFISTNNRHFRKQKKTLLNRKQNTFKRLLCNA